MMNRKIVFVLPFPPKIGAGGRKRAAIETLMEAHKKLGFDVVPLSLEPGMKFDSEILSYLSSTEKVLYEKVAIFKSQLGKRIARRIYNYILMNAVGKFRKENEIIFTVSFSMTANTSNFCNLLYKKYGVPFIINEHRTIFQRAIEGTFRLNKKEIDCLNSSKLVIALTDVHKESISNFCETEISVLPLALPESYFDVSTGIGSEINDDKFKIASWTNWREIKRLDVLVDAFVLLKNKIPKATLHIAGPTPDLRIKNLVLEVINKNNIQDDIFFLGELSRDDIRTLASGCDLCVIPSDHETFGLPATEALCCGVPVVTTRCGGPESFILEGINGYTAEKGNSEDIASKIIKFYEQRDCFDKSQIKKNAQLEFSVKYLSNKLDKMYQKFRLIS
jgi:glycosyltransferase involved in cell wall biosynthesis